MESRIDELRRKLAQAEDAVISIQYADDNCFTNGAYDRAARVRDEFQWALMEAEQEARLLAAGIVTASGEPGI